MAMKKFTDLKKVFKGVSSIRLATTVQASLATAAWDVELPVANDSLNIAQADGTLNPLKVYGQAGAWTIVGETGDISMSMFIPSIHADLMDIFYTKTTASLTGADETIGAVTGSYDGYGYFLTNEMIEGSAMIISEDRKNALFIRNVQGYPALVFDSPLDTPAGVNLTLQVAGGDTEADIAFLTWTPNA